MPIFSVNYKDCGGDECNVLVEGRNIEEATKRVREKRDPQIVQGASRIGLYIPKPGKPVVVEPTWVTRQGNVRRVSTLKTRTLKALVGRFETKEITGDFGIYKVLKDELDSRLTV